MLIQLAFNINELIGMSLLIGLALLLTVLSKVPIFKGFICYCLVIAPFLYQSELIDLWVIILLIVVIIYIDTVSIINKKRGVNN